MDSIIVTQVVDVTIHPSQQDWQTKKQQKTAKELNKNHNKKG